MTFLRMSLALSALLFPAAGYAKEIKVRCEAMLHYTSTHQEFAERLNRATTLTSVVYILDDEKKIIRIYAEGERRDPCGGDATCKVSYDLDQVFVIHYSPIGNYGFEIDRTTGNYFIKSDMNASNGTIRNHGEGKGKCTQQLPGQRKF